MNVSRLREGFLRIWGTRPGAWVLRYTTQPLDHLLYRLSGGRVMVINLFLPTLMLTTTGAKSGLPRSMPLLYFRDGARIVLLASNWGQAHHPAWYYNLRANPGCSAVIGGRAADYTAREAEGPEREELWRRAVAFSPHYSVYQARTDGRRIPIIVLEPTG